MMKLYRFHPSLYPFVESSAKAVAGIEAEFFHHLYRLTGSRSAGTMHDIGFCVVQFLNFGFEICVIEIDILTPLDMSARPFVGRSHVEDARAVLSYSFCRIFNGNLVIHAPILSCKNNAASAGRHVVLTQKLY